MLVFMLLGICVLLYYLHYRRSRQAIYNFAKSLPTTGELPVVGHAHWFIGGPERIYKNFKVICSRLENEGPVTSMWVGPALYIVPYNPEDIQIILENAIEKDSSYKFLQAWLGNGLFVATAKLWKAYRRLLLPVFNHRIIDNFIGIFGEQGDTLVKCLRQHSGQASFDVCELVTSCLLDIVHETAMGKKMDVQHFPDTPYLKARQTVMSIIHMRLFKPWMRPDILFRLTPFATLQEKNILTTHKFTDEVIAERIEAIKNANTIQNGPADILQCILEKKLEFSKIELREQLDSLTIAGNDTTALAISYALMLLGTHKDAQEKVYREIRAVFGDSLRSPTKEDLSKMEYLDRVIKETMRLYPPVPIFARITQAELKLSTCTVPPGVGCAILPFLLHRSKKIWGSDADCFNPDRFLPENSANRHPCAYLAFSFGPRNCIGRHFGMLVMKSILTNVLRSYKVSAENCERLKIEILLYPVAGHLITIAKRT